MLYAIISWDAPGALARRKVTREAHLARLAELDKAGRLKLAGPMPATDNAEPNEAGMVGSLLVIAFESLADAKTWANADPYVKAGVYREVQVHPFISVFPKSE